MYGNVRKYNVTKGNVMLRKCNVMYGMYVRTYVYMVQRSNPPSPRHGHGSAIVLSPSPPVVWWGCGTVWMVGMVCKSVGYGMFDMTVCMVCMVTMVGMECLLCKVGMVCMACMFGIVCMGGVVIMFHMYGMCGMHDRYDRYGMYGQSSYGMYGMYGIIGMYGRYGICYTHVVLWEQTGSK